MSISSINSYNSDFDNFIVDDVIIEDLNQLSDLEENIVEVGNTVIKNKKRHRESPTEVEPPLKKIRTSNSSSDSEEWVNNIINDHEPIEITLEKRYRMNEVWKRFLNKNPKDEALPDSERLDEATSLATYALNNFDNQTNIANLKSQMSQKYSGASISEQMLYGKLFALALKVVNITSCQGYKPGLPLLPFTNTKKGVKPSLPTRLLNATYIMHEATDLNGNLLGRKGMLILKKLGEGSYNKVSRVYHLGFKKELALRELNYNKMKLSSYNIPYAESMWEKEAKVHFALMADNIPGIVKLHELYILNSSNVPKVKAMMLEQCTGDGNDFVVDRKPLSKKDRISTFKQRITTLAEMHKKNWVHGDYKPGNIFYTVNEKGEIITKVGDFGFTEKAHLKHGGQGTTVYRPFDGFYAGNLGNELNTQLSKGTDAWAEGLVAYETKYGFFTKHYALTDQIYKFSQNFRQSPEVREFIALKSDSKTTREVFLHKLIARYPQAAVNLEAEKKNPEFYRVSLNDLITHLQNTIIACEYKNQHDQIFNNVCQNLINGTNGHLGDEEDQMIARLLNPDFNLRSTPEKEQHNLHLLA